MKKLYLGILGYIVPLWLSAQTEYMPNQLVGIWQYIQYEETQGQTQHLPIWKVMENDFTFKTFVIADEEGRCVITNTGTYQLVSDSILTEHIVGSTTDRDLIGKDNYITYQFESKDTLHISYRLPESTSEGKESWIRVKLKRPE